MRQQPDEFDRLLELRQSGVLDEAAFNNAWAKLVSSQSARAHTTESPPTALQDLNTSTATPPGWYPDQRGVTRFWDGEQWTTHVAPPPAPGVAVSGQAKNAMAMIGAALAAVGSAVAAFTQVSVISGMGTVWLGLGIALVGLIVAWVGGARLGLKSLCAILAIIAIASAVYDQHQLDQKRKEIQQILNTP